MTKQLLAPFTKSALSIALLTSSMMSPFLTPNVQANTKKNPNERWYQVDMILVEHNDPLNTNNELNPESVDRTIPAKVINLNSETDQINVEDKGVKAGKYAANLMFQPKLPSLNEVRPFIMLPKEEKRSADWIKSIERNGNYRILFEGSWRQPITNKKQAIPLRITGGNQFSDHHELEGQVLIHVSRYLHIETDLQLNRFRPIDMENGDLESMLNPSFDYAGSEYSQSTAKPTIGEKPKTSLFNGSVKMDITQAQEGVEYVPIQTAVLQQSRRMRSREVHYIDHPRMGLIIRFEPYDFPVADAEL